MSSKSKELKAQELLSTQNYTEKEPANKEAFSDGKGVLEGSYRIPFNDGPNINEPIKNTPFWVRGNDKDGFILTMGQYRITEPKESKEEAIELLESEKWDIIVRTIGAAFHAFENEMVQKSNNT